MDLSKILDENKNYKSTYKSTKDGTVLSGKRIIEILSLAPESIQAVLLMYLYETKEDVTHPLDDQEKRI